MLNICLVNFCDHHVDLYTDGEEMNLSSQVSYCEEDYTNMSALSDNSRQLADNTNEALTNNSLELVFVDKMSALSSLPLQQTQLDVKTGINANLRLIFSHKTDKSI